MKYIILAVGIFFSFVSISFAVESPQVLEQDLEVVETQSDFRILAAKAIDEDTIELMFTRALDNSITAVRAFVLEDEMMGTEIALKNIKLSEANPQKVLGELEVDLVPNTEYTITVLDIQDSSGNSIESGINAFVNFVTPETFEIPELNSAGSEAKIEEDEKEDDTIIQALENIIQEEESPEVKTEEVEQVESSETQQDTEVTTGKSGVNMDITEVGNETTKAGFENEKLPQTGPAMWMILGFFAIIGAGLYSGLLRKWKS